MNKETKIIISITAAAILSVILLMVLNPKASIKSTSIDPVYLVASTSHMTGLMNAKVTFVEFGDYQCPACAYMNPLVKEMVSEYKDNPDFNFVFRNFPLAMHRNAMIAAQAAEAAGAQGKFWEMNDLLYEKQDEWSDSTSPVDIFIKYAESLDLNTAKFKSDVESNKYKAVVLADKSDGDKINVSWTPSFYLNGELQTTVGNLDTIKSKIDLLLKK